MIFYTLFLTATVILWLLVIIYFLIVLFGLLWEALFDGRQS